MWLVWKSNIKIGGLANYRHCLNKMCQYRMKSSALEFLNPHDNWSTGKYGVVSIILGLAAIASSSHSHCDNGKGKSKPLSVVEFSKNLRIPIEKVRNRVKRQTPSLAVSTSGNTHQLNITTSLDVDAISLLLYWSQILGGDVDVTSTVVGGAREHSLIAGDKRSSLVLKLIPNGGINMTLYKDGGFTLNDIEYIVKGYDDAVTGAPPSRPATSTQVDPFFFSFFGALGDSEGGFSGNGEGLGFPKSNQFHGSGQEAAAGSSPIETLRQLGVEVFQQTDNDEGQSLDWDALAGCKHIKEQIDETVVLSVLHPDVYDAIAKKTRATFESNRPKAVLLEGPPGTGKTLTARILARKCARPLVHLRLESVVNKWYGESEKKLAKIFDACDALEGAIIFIDEVDAMASSRDNSEMHEATRRLLSVILQRTEGFQGKGKSLMLCATNRKQDLDPALLSRFDLTIRYDLPDADTRMAIIRRYAKQFTQDEPLRTLAAASEGFSCRDVKEACEQAERKWAARKIRGERLADVPGVDVYLSAMRARASATTHTNQFVA